jgi:uncharacterized membrane protein YqiK
VGAALAAIVVVIAVIVWKSYHSVPAGKALVINRGHGTVVTFTGRIVLPVLHRAEEIDVSVKQIVIDRRHRDGVICADNLRADLTATFYVRVNRAVEDILRVAQSVGCARAADPRTLEELFTAKFSEAIKTVAKKLEFAELMAHREQFKDQIIYVVGKDLNGYVLDDVAIDYLEQTSIEHLDPANVLDAQGIKKIRQLANVGERAPVKPSLEAELKRLGLLDVRVAVEVSCDISSERAPIALAIDGETTLGQLPSAITRGLLEVIGAGQLACGDGRATFRWTGVHVDQEQLLAGARLVHAFREDDHAYR